MGGAESKAAHPYPARWGEKLTVAGRKTTEASMKCISSMKPEEFLAVQAPTPELEAASFKFDDFKECAELAVQMDSGLNKLTYTMVPKKINEEEFWRVYYCHVHGAVANAIALNGKRVCKGAPPVLTLKLLKVGGETSSDAVIDLFESDALFQQFCSAEMDEIAHVEQESERALTVGVQMAVSKGVLLPIPEDMVVPVTIDVMGKPPQEVVDEVLSHLGDAPAGVEFQKRQGCVIVVQGVPGTSNGSIAAAMLHKALPLTVWITMGKVFRALTLLAFSHAESKGVTMGNVFSEEMLTPELLQELIGRLKFDKSSGFYDISIEGLEVPVTVPGGLPGPPQNGGGSLMVSAIADTLLKTDAVEANMALVAKVAQGEVIKKVASAADVISKEGMNVLIDGRFASLSYVNTPHRFKLTLGDPTIIGMRRAAQRIIDQTLLKLGEVSDLSAEEVKAALSQELVRHGGLSKAVLQADDDETSNAVIASFKSDTTFQTFASAETEAILSRDKEDDEKLAAGIEMAVAKGVVGANPPVEPLCRIDVFGFSASAVAARIIERLGDAPTSGCVLVLQGLSGTGKGTTVSKLQATLPRAVCWSNGNVFRSITLLAVLHAEQKKVPFGNGMLTPDVLKELMACLKFGKFGEKFDIQISGYGISALVSQVANTLLKEPRVGKNIPTVAKVTQGEVIKFAADAAEQMRADGMNVLMEGRAQTLDYVRTPHRFELTLANSNIIGMRRAAQRMSAQALARMPQGSEPSPEQVKSALRRELLGMAGAASLSKKMLETADDTTSNAVIAAFESDSTFQAFSKKETEAILQRDAEDDEKLATGIKMAVAKGVIPAEPAVEPLCKIDVMGKSADAVAAEIITQLGDAPQKGCVLILQGLSGTGKGTTVAKLQEKLPRATCWSNGNVFRAITLLAVTKAQMLGVTFNTKMLTPKVLEELMACLTFKKVGNKFDIQISGLGVEALVSEVANTLLKEPRVGKNIPTVAEVTQGEVIKFAAAAAETMRENGMNVLMEGRSQTLDYVRTPHRFELTLQEPSIIGMRRAAQRMIPQGLAKLVGKAEASPDEVKAALKSELESLAKGE